MKFLHLQILAAAAPVLGFAPAERTTAANVVPVRASGDVVLLATLAIRVGVVEGSAAARLVTSTRQTQSY